jgi:hypothetical protein
MHPMIEKLDSLPTRNLRHLVRGFVTEYATRHPEDFPAHQSASASIFFLRGRVGLSTDERLSLTEANLSAVTTLAEAHPDNQFLEVARLASAVLYNRAAGFDNLDEEAEKVAEQAEVDTTFAALTATITTDDDTDDDTTKDNA